MNLKYRKLKLKSGFSLVELLVAMIIAFVLFLSVGMLSRISLKTHSAYCKETQIHADISYGFKLMQKHVREAKSIPPLVAPGSPWVGSRLVVTPDVGSQHVFGLYQNTNSVDFVYLEDIDEEDEEDREVILSLSNADANSVDHPFTLTITASAKVYTIQIQGEKNDILFDMSTTIMRRA